MTGNANEGGAPGFRAFARAGLRAARFLCAALAGVLAAFAIGAPARAQSPSTSAFFTSYITPFPQSDRYQAMVIGDWLASGLASGLQEAMKQENSVQITDNAKGSAGLTRQIDWAAEADKIVKAGNVQIVVILMGVNDARDIRAPSGEGRIRLCTPEWRDAYTKEAAKLIKAFRAANIAVYWVGLPAMSNPTLSKAVEVMNDAVRQAAYLNNAKFIDTWNGFTDQSGAYTPYGADLTGQEKRLRDADGVGFTAAGNRKLAYYLEIVLKRDLEVARQQRNVPLAGDEEEQERIVPKFARGLARSMGRTAETQPPAPNNDEANRKPRQTAAPAQEGPAPSASAAPVSPNTPSAPGPAPEASRSAALARQDQAAFATPIAPADVVLGDLSSGLTSIAVISPLNDVSLRDSQRRIPLSERLYFRVLSKGDALPPKEGRADDFAWTKDSQGGNPAQGQAQ
jgi:hypothetical protein